MFLQQQIALGLTKTFNGILALDPESQQRLAKLQGRSLQVSLTELPWPLLFTFSDTINIQILEMEQPTEANAADCVIELNLETLPKLKDTSRLTQLIQQKKLNLIGDIYVAQSFSDLLKELDIDWEEHLSRYTGDVVAHQLMSSSKQFIQDSQGLIKQFLTESSAKLTQPESIGVSKNEAWLFSDKVAQLRNDVDRIEARIRLLEQQAKPMEPSKQ